MHFFTLGNIIALRHLHEFAGIEQNGGIYIVFLGIQDALISLKKITSKIHVRLILETNVKILFLKNCLKIKVRLIVRSVLLSIKYGN